MLCTCERHLGKHYQKNRVNQLTTAFTQKQTKDPEKTRQHADNTHTHRCHHREFELKNVTRHVLSRKECRGPSEGRIAKKNKKYKSTKKKNENR